MLHSLRDHVASRFLRVGSSLSNPTGTGTTNPRQSSLRKALTRVYLESDRGHRGLAPSREDSEVMLHEGAVAELDGRPGGHVVEAVFGYPVSPFRLRGRLRPAEIIYHTRTNKTRRHTHKGGRMPGYWYNERTLLKEQKASTD